MRKLGLPALLLSAASLGLAQTPASVFLGAPASSVICGNQLSIAALVQDQSGNVIASPTLTWATGNSTIATVDSSGNVTALLPGIVNITATAGRATGTFQIQTLPLRIDVTPANQALHIGDQIQYAAAVLDANQQPLAAAVTWQVAGPNGFNTSEAHISASGLLTASAATSLTIRAAIVYNNPPSDFVPQFIGETGATVLPPADYTISRLLTSDDTRQSFQLLARRGGIAVNDIEQLVSIAALDGLSDGVLLADQSGNQILASGGVSTLMPGGNLVDFEDPAINNSGTVVLRADTMGNSGGLLLLSKNQFQYLLTDGTTSGYTDFENTRINRFSLNDNGALVFTASYLPVGSATRAVGLFDLQRNLINLDISSPGSTLPGLEGNFNFDPYYGMDSGGNIYFGASDGFNHGVYQVTSDGVLSMALGTGDHLRGSIVRNINGIGVGFSGDLAIGCDRPDGSQFLLRFAGGNLAVAPEVLPVNGFSQVYRVNSAGVLFLGDGGQGWGLYVWPPKATAANAVLMQGNPAPSGDEVVEIQGASMTSAGVVFAKVRTAGQPLEMLRIDAKGAAILAQSGDQLSVTANLTLMGLVPGASNGDAHPLMGGYQSSVFQMSSTAGLIPRVVLGDRLNSAPYYGNLPARKALDGTLYVVADDGLYRVGAGSNSLVIGFPHADADGVTQYNVAGENQYLSGALAANESGAVAWIANTNQNHERLCLSTGGQTQILAYIGNNSQYRTSSPTGGFFSGWQEIALDNAGRLMARFSVTGGPSGYFLWTKGQWTAAALFGETLVAGQPITGAGEMKASSANFYATLSENGSNSPSVLAEYGASGWTQLLAQGQTLPDGSLLNSLTHLVVNRADDVAFSAWANGPEIVVLTGGTMRQAYTSWQLMSDGSFLSNIVQIDFRDDHRVFFVGFDMLDRVNLYVAQPTF